MFQLFRSKRFWPLFVTQFLGAFNDNFLKCAILTLVTFKVAASSAHAAMLTNLAMALFIFPYFLFSAIAGEITDAYDKAKICRIVKFIEIILMAAAAIAFLFYSIPCLLFLLFLMGTQSTFFSPSKYSLLPQQLRANELVAGNALIEGGTFLAILAGTLFGCLFIVFDGGEWIAGGILLLFAIIGYITSRSIPPTPPLRRRRRKISPDIVSGTVRIIRYGLGRAQLRHLILPLSLFWLIGSLYISQLPGLCRDVLGANEAVNTILFMAFSIGIAIGALAANRLLRGKISPRLAVPAAIIMGVVAIDLGLSARTSAPAAEILVGPVVAFAELRTWRVFLDLLVIAIAGGIFSVPLQACMQHRAPAGFVARVIACNNIINALYMASGAAIAATSVKLFDLSCSTMLFTIAALSFIMAYSSRYSK